MKLQKYALPSLLLVLFVSTLSLVYDGASAKAFGEGKTVNNSQTTPLSVGDFFLTEDELPAGWIPDPGPYTPNAHMLVKEKLMGGDWWSVRIRNTEMSRALHVTIGLFPTEAEAIKYADPDTYIYSTDAYQETGQTFTEVLQMENSQYSLSGGTVFGDGGFSGGYQHQEFQPFNVFRVGQVLIHTDASDPSGEGILEQLLVDKARRLQNLAEPADDNPPTDNDSDQQQSAPTLTPQVQGSPIVLKASLDGKGEATQTISNPNNFGVVTIDGKVTDQAGNGVGGAQVEIVSGADAASSISNADGSYLLAVSVPSGKDSTTIAGINFTLQIADLSIDRVVLLQAIEGGQLVSYRDVGVRVFLNWEMNDPVDIELTVTVDGLALPPVQGIAKKEYTQLDRNRGTDAVNLVIPKDHFPSWGDSSHTLTAVVRILSPEFVDADPSNNTSTPQNFSLKQTKAVSILYVSLDKSISKSALVNFAAQAHSFLNKVYPVSYSWGFVGTQQVSHYLVSPYVNFMKSLDADDLPYSLGNIGIVEGGLEVGKSFTYKAAIISIEKARRLYNSQRCKDAQGKLILPCPDEVALQAVGVYPEGAFGSSKDGFAFADRRDEWRAAANSQTKPDNVAHELGHLFGFGEEYSSSSFGVPVTGSTWDGVQFQTANGSCVNIMGNIGLACPWINAQTWNSLLDGSLRYSASSHTQVASIFEFTPRFEPLYAEVQEPALMIEGLVTSAQVGILERVTDVDRYQPSENSNGPFKLAARDASGNLLGEIGFDGLFFDLDINPIAVSPFLVLLPVTDPHQVTEIILTTSDGKMLDTLVRSSSLPQVSFDPLPTEIQDQATITWQASDGDGDPLLSTLYYSNNGGLNWQVLGLDMPVSNFSLDATELPGGSGLLKVSVSDGFNTAESVSAPLSLPDQAPIITIILPWGTEFEYQEMVSIEAVAYDLEDGLLPSDTIQWFDGKGSLLGTGTMLQTTLLGGGTNQLTAKVQDSTGKVSESSVDIHIAGDSPLGSLPFSIPFTNTLYLIGLCACTSLLGGGFLVGGVFLFARRRKASRLPTQAGQGLAVQDQQGNWWYQDPANGRWFFWNGQAWLPAPGVTSNLAASQRVPVNKPRSGQGACLLSLLISGGIALVVVGGISLVAFNFFPAYQITTGQGDITEILKMGAGGLLVTILGLLLLNGGFKAIITRRAFVEDEWGRRSEKRGCGAILNGLGQLFFGLLCLVGGLSLMTLTLYQEVLPWLGF